MDDMSRESRRDFMKKAVATSVAAGSLATFGAPAIAQEKKSFKIGLIGCGGRGTGALDNCLQAGKVLGLDLKVVALADAFEDRLRGPANQHKVPRSNVFV